MIKVLGTYILLKAEEVKDKTEGGIILSDESKELPCYGVVVGVGDEVRNDIHNNDKVVFNKYGFSEVKINGNDYLYGSYNDLIAIYE